MINRRALLGGGLASWAGLSLVSGRSVLAAEAGALLWSRGRAELRYSVVELKLRHAWTLSRNSSTGKRNHIVELACDGIIGRGEAAPNVRFHETPESVERALKVAAEIVAAVHPSRRVELLRRLQQAIPEAHSARCAVDLALWDWLGKRLATPLWQLWGLDPSSSPLTSFSIAIAERAELEVKVREAAPFPLLKVKLGAKGAAARTSDREIVETIHRLAPDKQLRVDPNEGWSLDEAREKLGWLGGLKRQSGGALIELCEQPLPAAERAAQQQLYETPSRPRALPLLLDESVLSAGDLSRLPGSADGVVIKLQKAGGLTGALEQITVARALGLKVMLGCMIETAVGISAAAQLAPLCDYIDLDGNLLIERDPYRGVIVQGGRLTLPSGPGLGVEPVG